jgi:hypothetical protein
MKLRPAITAFLYILLASAFQANALPPANMDGYEIYKTSEAPELTEEESALVFRFKAGKYTVQVPRELPEDRVTGLSDLAANGYAPYNKLTESLKIKFQQKRQKYLGLLLLATKGISIPQLPKSLRRLLGGAEAESKKHNAMLESFRTFDALLFSQSSNIAGQPIKGVFSTGAFTLMTTNDLAKFNRIIQILTLGLVKVNPDLISQSKFRYINLGYNVRGGVMASISDDGRSVHLKTIFQIEQASKPFSIMPAGCAIGADLCVGFQTGGDEKGSTKGTSVSMVGVPVRLTSMEDGGLMIALSVLPPVYPNPLALAMPMLPPVLGTFDMGFTAKFKQVPGWNLKIPLMIKGSSAASCQISFAPDDVQ